MGNCGSNLTTLILCGSESPNDAVKKYFPSKIALCVKECDVDHGHTKLTSVPSSLYVKIISAELSAMSSLSFPPKLFRYENIQAILPSPYDNLPLYG